MFAALPPDVREVSDLPTGPLLRGGYAQGHSPKNQGIVSGKAEPFRTSGGKAADVPLLRS
jgi:hypothetical protein